MPVLERVTTDQLREGDVVHVHGMVVILGPIHSSDDDPLPVYWSHGQVENPDAARKDGLLWSLLHKSFWNEEAGHWEVRFSGVWTVQGNKLASWSRELKG